jgi:hypothetical protein
MAGNRKESGAIGKKRLMPVKWPLVLCFRRFSSRKQSDWNCNREHSAGGAVVRRMSSGSLIEDGACYKMVTAGALRKPLERAWAHAQAWDYRGGSNRSGCGFARLYNLGLPQSEHVCRRNARPSPKNDYTSRAYQRGGHDAGGMFRGAITGPGSSVGVAGEANV